MINWPIFHVSFVNSLMILHNVQQFITNQIGIGLYSVLKQLPLKKEFQISKE